MTHFLTWLVNLVNLQSKRSGFHHGPNWRYIGEACFFFLFSFFFPVPYCICVFFGTEPFGKYISIWATVALLTHKFQHREPYKSLIHGCRKRVWRTGPVPRRKDAIVCSPDLIFQLRSKAGKGLFQIKWCVFFPFLNCTLIFYHRDTRGKIVSGFDWMAGMEKKTKSAWVPSLGALSVTVFSMVWM